MKTILEMIGESGGFKILNKAVEVANLTDVLRGPGAITVFAPTDRAFEKLPYGVIDELLEDPETLDIILKYHIVPEKLFLEEIGSRCSLKTLAGDELTVGVSIYGSLINDSKVITPDIECSNGVVHVINYVLFPGLIKVKEGL